MASILSACLVLYHCGDELTHALRCIQNADVDVDVFLADNTPDDPTAEKAEWLFPGVTVLPQKGNIGFGRANNAVIPHLQSKYHLIMNPDVTFEPSLLSRMIMYMEAHPNIAILTPRVLNEDGTEQFLPKKRISVHYLLGGLFENYGKLFRRWRADFTMSDMDIVYPVPVEFATGRFLFIRPEPPDSGGAARQHRLPPGYVRHPQVGPGKHPYLQRPHAPDGLCLQVFPEMGDHMVKTAVLLTAYNGGAHLPALLESLAAPTDSDFTVLMQDDGSTDETPSLLSGIAERDSRFLFGSEQGCHLGAAGNFLSLLRQCDADYVLFCDQDDFWEPEKITVLKQAILDLEKQYGAPVPLLVHSDCSLIDESGSLIGSSFFRHQGWDPQAVTLPQLLVQNNVTGCTLIMNASLRRLVSAHAVARDLFMHDWFVALTAAAFGHIAFVDKPLTRYRQHGDNAIGASSRSLLVRGMDALHKRKDAKRRILLTYTHTAVFGRLYGENLPPQARDVVDRYLATRHMRKIPRVLAVRRMGCVMQNPVTRLGQLLFG